MENLTLSEIIEAWQAREQDEGPEIMTLFLIASPSARPAAPPPSDFALPISEWP
jgi:hypothetical protein